MMRTDFDYSPYYYKKDQKPKRAENEKSKPQKSRPPKTRTRYTTGQRRGIAICAAVIAISIICFIIFSGGKSAGAAVSIGGSNYYAVNLGTYADESLARVQSDRVRARGAAGYIAEDNNFKVLASCYTAKKDAESVIANLKKSNTQASLFMISVPAVKLSNISQNAKAAIEEALLFHSKIYGGLYALTVDIDTGKAGADSIRSALEAVISSISGVMRKLDNIGTSDAGAALAHIKALYVSQKNMLETINLAENYFDISVNLRYNYLKIIFMYIELFKEINI